MAFRCLPATAGRHRWFIDWTGTHGYGGKCHWDEQWPLGSYSLAVALASGAEWPGYQLVYPIFIYSLDLIFLFSDLPPNIDYNGKGSSGIIDLTLIGSVGGCICCTVRGDLIAGLKKILKRQGSGCGNFCGGWDVDGNQCWNLVVLLYFYCSLLTIMYLHEEELYFTWQEVLDSTACVFWGMCELCARIFSNKMPHIYIGPNVRRLLRNVECCQQRWCVTNTTTV